MVRSLQILDLETDAMLKISWKDKVTNASVLETVEVEKRMLNNI